MPKFGGLLRKRPPKIRKRTEAGGKFHFYSRPMQLSTSSATRGFTLLELLVVVALVGILSSLLLPALSRGKQQARQMNEMGAGRQLATAWQMHADENEDAVLPGYVSSVEATDDRGQALASPIRDRYPWRLAPQLANNFRAIYVNDSRRFLEEAAGMSHSDYVYRASLYPSLGYNSVFLGGDEQKFHPALATPALGVGWLVTRVSQIERPSAMLAFASARARPGGGRDEAGHHVVHPPYLRTRQWDASFAASRPPEKFGYVHPRWKGRAVAALTDSHAELLSQTHLQDMRRWCNVSAGPDWTLSALP